VWTSALLPGFRPTANAAIGTIGFLFTATISLATEGKGTRYSATVIHADEEGCKKHAAMGFVDGWGKALDQLVAYSQKM